MRIANFSRIRNHWNAKNYYYPVPRAPDVAQIIGYRNYWKRNQLIFPQTQTFCDAIKTRPTVIISNRFSCDSVVLGCGYSSYNYIYFFIYYYYFFLSSHNCGTRKCFDNRFPDLLCTHNNLMRVYMYIYNICSAQYRNLHNLEIV